jgi:hypothetical protein
MAVEADLHVEVQGDEIIVTLPGTHRVTYYRATPHELLAKSYSGQEADGGSMTKAEFLARAWKLANDKARELGWIV